MHRAQVSSSSTDRAALILAGTLVFALALAVLVGWMTHSVRLIRINPAFSPMPINTALALAGAGSALIFAGLSRDRIAVMLGLVSCALGWLGSYPGEWFASTPLAFAAAAPGFAAFVFSGIKTRSRTLGWSGSALSSLALAVFIGYAAGVNRSMSWAPHAQMAVHAAAAFMAVGIVFIILGWKRVNANLPFVLVMCLGLLVAFEIHAAFSYAEDKVVQKNFEYDAHNRTLAVERELQLQLRLRAYQRAVHSPVLADTHELIRVSDISRLLDRALAGLAPSPVDIYLFDRSIPDQPRYLGYFGSKLRSAAERSLNTEEIRGYKGKTFGQEIRFADRVWEVKCLYLKELDTNRKPWLPWTASGAVMGFAALLASFLWAAMHRARIIEDTVQLRTAQLEKANQALEEEIRQRRIAEAKLEEQRKNLEKTNAELDSFVYTASHDLRAPLRAIASFAAFLQEDCGPQLGAQGKDHLDEIRKGAMRMNQLIDDLLTLSRISRVGSPFERVPVREMIASVMERLSFDIHAAGAEVVIAPDLPTIVCDRVNLTEVFFNLVSNAVKFSSKRSGVRGRVEIGWRDRGDQREFFVKDNGIGIDPAYHEQIFGIFKRLHGSEAYEGTGVGLSIVKRVIEDHGGRIWVDSKSGQGAVFCFALPKTPGERAS